MAHQIEAVFVFDAFPGATIVLGRSDELVKRPVHFSALLRKPDGREVPIKLSYIFAAGPNVDRSKLSYSVSGVDRSEVSIGDEIVVREDAC